MFRFRLTGKALSDVNPDGTEVTKVSFQFPLTGKALSDFTALFRSSLLAITSVSIPFDRESPFRRNTELLRNARTDCRVSIPFDRESPFRLLRRNRIAQTPTQHVSIPFQREIPFRPHSAVAEARSGYIGFRFRLTGKALSDKIKVMLTILIIIKFQFPSNGKSLSD